MVVAFHLLPRCWFLLNFWCYISCFFSSILFIPFFVKEFSFILKIHAFIIFVVFFAVFCFITAFIYIDHSRVNGAPPHPTISLPNRLSKVFYLPPRIFDLVVQVSCPSLPLLSAALLPWPHLPDR